MKLIQYLGIKNFGTYRKKIGLYECPICKKHFEVICANVKNESSTKCKSCAISIKNKNSSYSWLVIKNTTHGLRKHPLYQTRISMIERTTKSSYSGFINYGARGISVCDEWRNDFMSFYNWAIENGYKKGLSIDRINNDGNYEPLNCRWVERNIQARNTRVLRSTNTSGYRGVSFFKSRNTFRARITINYKLFIIGYFKTAEEAGYAYDKYVIDNGLEHTTNGLYTKGIL